jgi:hypothetical protein
MNKLSLALAAALVLLPAVAPAQQNSPPPGGMQSISPQLRAAMHQMRTLHEQFRTQVLDALTPAHRTMVADALGQLAVSSNPSPRAVAAQIDGALSANEKQQILAAHQSFLKQMIAFHQQMESQMHNGAGMPQHADAWQKQGMMSQAPSAGEIVLHALTMEPLHMMMMMTHMMHGGPPQGAPPQH